MITTLNAAIAGLLDPVDLVKTTGTMEAVGVLHSLFYTAGLPGAAVAPSPGLAGVALTSYAGQIPFQNPVSGETRLARLECESNVAGSLLIADRLWHNSGIVVTTTTAQTVNSPTWPARCRQGSTDGDGVMVGLEVSAATTNAGAISNCTLSYTNSAGVAGRTATLSSIPSTSVAGTFLQFLLQAGDTGVRSVQSITLGTSLVTGTVHLVAYRMITRLGVGVNVSNDRDFVRLMGPRLYDSSVLFGLWRPTATTAVTIQASLSVTQG